MPEPIRIPDVEIGGVARTLVCKPWPYRQGRRWLTRIVRVLGKAASEGADVGVGEILDALPDSFLDELLDACEANTHVVTIDELGKPTAVPFSKIVALLEGRYDVTLRVARAHVELNFAPFFASLGTVLGEVRLAVEGGEEVAG